MNSADTGLSMRVAIAHRYPAKQMLPLIKIGWRVIWYMHRKVCHTGSIPWV
jgi:hypothetical protein